MASDATTVPESGARRGPESDVGKSPFWPRAAFMVAFAILFAIAETVMLLVAVLQALWLAFAKAPNPRIKAFGASLAAWLAQAGRYQACATEEKPFPWADWPKG